MISEELKDFLREEGVLEQFEENASNLYSGIGLDIDIDSISEAFTWDESPEGDDFWRSLNNKYGLRL